MRGLGEEDRRQTSVYAVAVRTEAAYEQIGARLAEAREWDRGLSAAAADEPLDDEPLDSDLNRRVDVEQRLIRLVKTCYEGEALHLFLRLNDPLYRLNDPFYKGPACLCFDPFQVFERAEEIVLYPARVGEATEAHRWDCHLARLGAACRDVRADPLWGGTALTHALFEYALAGAVVAVRRTDPAAEPEVAEAVGAHLACYQAEVRSHIARLEYARSVTLSVRREAVERADEAARQLSRPVRTRLAIPEPRMRERSAERGDGGIGLFYLAGRSRAIERRRERTIDELGR